MKTVIVIPSKNEQGSIARTIDDLNAVFRDTGRPMPVILLTDDSVDGTRAIAQEKGAEIVNGGGKGLGFAMYQGLKAALRYSPGYIITYDADGQADPKEIPVFLEELEKDRCDLVLASRFLREDLIGYRYPFINRFGTIVLSRILRAFTGFPHTDSHGGIRAMKPEVAAELEMLGTHTYVQETIIDAHEKGFRIKELPSAWLKREHGKSRVVASIPTYIFYTLPILILRSRQHIKWLYTAGILLVLAALGVFGAVFWQSGFSVVPLLQRVPALLFVSLLVVTGILLFFFGFILQLLKAIKYRVDRAVYLAEKAAIR